MTKKALFLRLIPKKVDLIPEKVVSLPKKKVDSFSEKVSSIPKKMHFPQKKSAFFSIYWQVLAVCYTTFAADLGKL